MMKSVLSLLILWSIAALLGCAGSGAFLEGLASNPDVEAGTSLMAQGVATSSGLEGGAYGAIITAAVGFVFSFIRSQFRAKRKLGEVHGRINKLDNKVEKKI